MSRELRESESAINEELRAKQLREVLGQLVALRREEGVPVDENCRIPGPDVKYDPAFLHRATRKELLADGGQFEVYIVGLLQKAIGGEFLVVRSARGDDTDGIDTVLIDRKSGEVVCAFDEVVAHGGEFTTEKKKLVQRKNEQGGATLQRGLIKDNGKFAVGEVRDIPAYVLRMGPEKLHQGVMQFELVSPLSFSERQNFKNLLEQLESQNRTFAADKRIPEPLLGKIARFKERLEEIRQEWYIKMRSEVGT